MCQGSADILSGNSYVAANKERFKKVDYLSVGDGSPRGYVRKTLVEIFVEFFLNVIYM